MKNLGTSFRALHVLYIASDLFKQYGFHKVGIDRIISETKISKATFYNYFHSKERLIEMCLLLQKDTLMEKVRVEIETTHYSTFAHKLRQIYLLHANLKSAYYLLFKAIFEIKTNYPIAYQTAIRYRRWIKNEIFCLLMETKKAVSYAEAEIFIFMIDGAILGFLTSDRVEEQTKLLDYFLVRVN
ncbi:TetR/AcrR family transcriptional regulator [Acinetobacter baumannii]|uniref:TetR/AcrR family transcriptional regulator n=1 Tax=Acinetobacter baumannii TaxID=470 RepID=UPI00044DC4ED|nr:TetR/AcrR family transcriptional regulator [Acinetobacter baumannii]EXA63357.1 bacterial regulatory s, tetR family protein [Acinetobacter baumannii 1035119]MDC5040748.1 TetR/AcrR family transcriptional regulator [Acinetobacter baumannii]